MDGPLSQYRPLRWDLVGTAAQRRQWRQLLERHHYLGAPPLVGANLKYLVYGRTGELLGALGWQSAVQHLGCRDGLLGWNAAPRARGLDQVVNGVRFLVLPWVKVRHLASVLLSENLDLLRTDWPRHYGVPVWLAESFVDRQRFRGASYRAANWQAIGWTRGFAKRQGHFVHHGQRKEVYVYVEPVPKGGKPCWRGRKPTVDGRKSGPIGSGNRKTWVMMCFSRRGDGWLGLARWPNQAELAWVEQFPLDGCARFQANRASDL